MLLRGVKFAPPTLDRADIEATKSKSSSSGRSFGGVPFRGGRGNGRGRGGHINYANDRPNPFAAHINPGFAPSMNSYGRGGPSPSGHFPGYQASAPPAQGSRYHNGAPPQPEYYSGQGYHGAYGASPGQQPPQNGGYYNGSPQLPLHGPSDHYGYAPGPTQNQRYYSGR